MVYFLLARFNMVWQMQVAVCHHACWWCSCHPLRNRAEGAQQGPSAILPMLYREAVDLGGQLRPFSLFRPGFSENILADCEQLASIFFFSGVPINYQRTSVAKGLYHFWCPPKPSSSSSSINKMTAVPRKGWRAPKPPLNCFAWLQLDRLSKGTIEEQ